MNRIVSSAIYAAFFACLITPCEVGAQDLDKAEKALKMISEFAKNTCDAPPLTGSNTTVELNANGKAEVAKLIKQLAELNIEVAGKYQKSDYAGLLQKDLVAAMQDTRTCKQKVFKELSDKLIQKLPS